MEQQNPSFHAQPVEEVLHTLDVRLEHGLTKAEVAARCRRYGWNRRRRVRRRSAWAILGEQFASIVVILLVVAGALAFAFGQWTEGVAISAVIFINGTIGFVSEWRAVRSMEALRQMVTPKARVRRAGQDQEVEIKQLVPGDIVLLEGGDIVPADIRLIEANSLRVNEAALTGESAPVNKRCEPVEADRDLAGRSDMLFNGTTIVQGSAQGVVVAIGMQTELGRISELAEKAGAEVTPLERRLNRLGQRLAWVVSGVAAVVAGVGLWAGQPTLLMIETAIALGVAAIPEGLPIVATLALARGMWLMAKRQALINRLPAVEALGGIRTIFTDKTGTLTKNQMVVRRIVTPTGEHDWREAAADKRDTSSNAAQHNAGGNSTHDPVVRRLLEVGVLCNNASLRNADTTPEGYGDPTEIALLRAGVAVGLRRDELLEQKPEIREVAFDPAVMMMATFHQAEEGFEVAVKGAPPAVLEACESIVNINGDDRRPLQSAAREEWLDRTMTLAGQGFRLLAMADKQVSDSETKPYTELRLLGLVGLLDPPRPDVDQAIAACQQAGIRVVMVTGDQLETARTIGKQVGLVADDEDPALQGRELGDLGQVSTEMHRQLLDTRIFARISPAQKLRLVEIFQDNGDLVAMTGDGVNDVPALKQADIGVAMGQRGTDAARQAADMVLKDDAFSSIVAAVEQGRVIFTNIRKSVLFMLCTNVAEIVAVTLAALASAPLPLRPLQILYLNVLTDVFPALALGVGPGNPRVMQQPPRSAREAVLTRSHWLTIAGWSVGIALCVLAALALALQWLAFDPARAVTVSFLTLGFAKLWFVLNLRDPGSRLWQNDVGRNPWIWAAIGLCTVLLIATVSLPQLSALLHTRPLGGTGWGIVLVLSVLPLLVGQVIRMYHKRRH
ncbi:MAG: cation-translocating P-type ATPase [Candidatus Binatia bacterium]